MEGFDASGELCVCEREREFCCAMLKSIIHLECVYVS